MGEPDEIVEDEQVPTQRTEESVAAAFPDRGEFPGNEIVVDPDAPPAPNIQHPR